MTSYDSTQSAPKSVDDKQDGPEPGATEEAVALHGDKAVEETTEQPAEEDVTVLDSSTRIYNPQGDGSGN